MLDAFPARQYARAICFLLSKNIAPLNSKTTTLILFMGLSWLAHRLSRGVEIDTCLNRQKHGSGSLVFVSAWRVSN